MSNISRRDFMKTAGVMTLAVAASGVLAGCSTAAEEEVVQTSATSATVGDYTLSIVDTKLVKSTFTAVTNTTDTSKTVEYLAVLMNVKSNKEGKTTPSFDAEIKKSGLVNEVTVAGTASSDTAVSKKGLLKNVFDREKLTPSTTVTVGTDTISGTLTNGYPTDGDYFYKVYTVAQNSDESFVTPSFKIIVDNDDKQEYVTLTATIPAAIEVAPNKLNA